MRTEDGRLVVVAGASRSGKTVHVTRRVNNEPRVFVWDPEDQWARLPNYHRVTRRAELLRAVQRPGSAHLAYVAGGALAVEFDFWCGCVYYAGRYVGPLVAVAEEVADVTSTAKAPGNWGILLRRGLKRGVTIFAISQRWAEADKTAVGNASEFVLFRMSSGDDIAYMARKTRVPATELEGLKPLHYVRFDAATGAIERGRLRF